MIQTRLGRGYCIDTCALIDLWRRYYPPDVFPGLWADIERLIRQRRLIAPREVLEELRGVDDEILEWARRFKMMFIALDEGQLREVSTILEESPGRIDPSKTKPDADPFLIALAKTMRWTVVTSELPRTSPVQDPVSPTCARAVGLNASPSSSSSENEDGSTCRSILHRHDLFGVLQHSCGSAAHGGPSLLES